jgi:hypothetical protein
LATEEGLGLRWILLMIGGILALMSEQSKPDEKKRSDPAIKPGEAAKPAVEIGGPKGPEPTRYGDWERGGRCSDF